jgi:transposase
MAYPLELRERAISKLGTGLTQREAAGQLAVSVAWVNKIWQCHQAHGVLFPPRKVMGRPPRLDAEARCLLRSWVDEDPDQTRRQLADRLTQRLGRQISDLNVLYALKALRYAHKKNGRSRRAKTA